MSFSETVFLFFLALIIFGPKKLPEMARQAGRILAELRRASNEFKSQIESEISHIELQKNLAESQQAQPPQGTVASLSLNPASSESVPHNPPPAATLAAPTSVSTSEISPAPVEAIPSPVASNPVSLSSHESASEAATHVSDPLSDPASQASHV